MYRKTALWLLLAMLISGLAASMNQVSPPAYAQDAPQSDPWALQILEADERHVLLELSMSSFESERIVHEGTEYQRLRVAGWPSWGQPGQPQLPMYSIPLGMPRLGSPHISVLEAESETLTGYVLHPTPAMERSGTDEAPQVAEGFVLDSSVYSADTFYPGPLAEAASIGFLRDQPLFQLRLYPLQYNPLRQELRFYRRLKVLIAFPESTASLEETDRAQPVPVFERILERTLLNYDALPRPAPRPARLPVVTLHTLDNGPQVKLRVEQSGLYRVTYDDLLAVAPALLQVDPRHLELSNQGSPVPVLFEGETDGSFDPGDSLLFYGQAIHSDYTRYNVYWLHDRGAPGLRMPQRDGTPGTGATPNTFRDHRHYEQDRTYWQAVPNGEGEDHWFWNKLSVNSATPVSVDYAFDLHHIATGGPDGELRVLLHGVTGGDHLTQFYLNGVALLSPAEQVWSGQVPRLYEIPVSQDRFVEGTNHLKVENTLPPGSSVSTFYVNWFEVTYGDTYVAEEDYLSFSAPSAGGYAFALTGFSTSAVRLFDITDFTMPVRIVNFIVEPASGSYRLRFSDVAAADQRYLAQRVDQLPRPSLQLDEPSAWKSPAHGATYLIITHPQFYDALQPLATYRASLGETVVTVKTDDLYDEFSYGIYGPQAIRSFLEYAYHNWSPQPVYVLLVGDASLDPKNNRGSSLPDLLPAYYVDTPIFGQAPNDAWYAKVHGDDDYPDLIVGRITARWGTDIVNVTSKVQAYEGSPPPGDWMRRAILVADDDLSSFHQDMETVAGLLPASITPVKMYSYNPSTSVRSQVNYGALLLAYSGHGSMDVWGKWGTHQIFTTGDIQNLSNGNRLPFMTVGNCLNGFFADYTNYRAMTEEFLLLNNRGGIASWAPSSYSFPTVNSLMLEELYQALLVDHDLVLGSAATTARIQAYLRRPDTPLSLFETFTFLGDPAVRLNLPPTLELGGWDTPDPVTMGEVLTYTLTYTISGAEKARGLTLVNTLPQGILYQSAIPTPSSIYIQNLTWNQGDTPAGSYTITVLGRVKTTGLAHGQILQNQARLYDTTGGDQILQIKTTVRDIPITGLVARNNSPTELGSATALSATTTSGTNIVYTWDLGDASPRPTGPSVQHIYPAIGTYLVQITATNGVSSQSQTTTVTITDVPPVARFTSSSPDRLGQTTTFRSTSAGTNLTYRWDFGDGSPPVSGYLPTVTHTYIHTGTYSVGLTTSNSVGSSTASGTVRILPEVSSPSAGFTSSSPDELGQTTVFLNTSQDGGDDEGNVKYSWKFGDGTSSTAQHPTHTYTAPGTYLVSLTISNSVASDTFSDSVLITDAPIAGLALSYDGPTPLGHTTTLSATVASGTNIAYHWELGDGAFSVGQTLTHTYGAMGTYTVVLTATNSMGTQTVTGTVTIVDKFIEGLTISHSGPTALGSATAFTASIAAGTNVTYLWELGDGSTSTSQNLAHTYTAVGDYTVALTATNSWGSLVRQDTVSVYDVPISGLSVSHSGPTMLGTPTLLAATVTAGTNVAYDWDLGDGDTATAAHVMHTYSTPGTYSLTVTANNGTSQSTVSTSVAILDPDLSLFLPLIFRNSPP